MEKHLLISNGCKGWGGPLTITPGQGKKIASRIEVEGILLYP